MNPAYVHILANHFPIVGVVFGSIVFYLAYRNNNVITHIAADILFIISGLGAAISYFSGENAEELVEKIQGISHQAIHQHEETGLWTLISFIILALLAIASLYIQKAQNQIPRILLLAKMAFSIIACLLVLNTAKTGGHIRHSEFYQSNIEQNSEKQIEHEEH